VGSPSTVSADFFAGELFFAGPVERVRVLAAPLAGVLAAVLLLAVVPERVPDRRAGAEPVVVSIDGSMRVAESAAATRPSRYGALCGAPGRVRDPAAGRDVV
jgi:hypothetical protein